eukprot:5461044-Ditylum_brightwellii.AAC.1
MFEGDELSEAMGVPLFYGLVEALVLGVYCLIAWKLGWTKAPSDDPIWKVLATSYEVLAAEAKELEAIEVSYMQENNDGAESVSEFGDTIFHYFRLDCGGGRKEPKDKLPTHTAEIKPSIKTKETELPCRTDETIQKDDDTVETIQSIDQSSVNSCQSENTGTKIHDEADV